MKFPVGATSYWTSGQRLNASDCKSRFVWKPWNDKRIPFVFDSWVKGDPNCKDHAEFCMHIWAVLDFKWNDYPCKTPFFPLCEFNP